MNEIEAKRKELENRILHLRARYMFDLSKKKEEELKGFNLGVEMARKEILDKLLDRAKEHDDTKHEGEYFNPDCNQSFRHLIFELKQSLEDKKK